MFETSFILYFTSYVVAGHRAPGQMLGRAKAGLVQLCRREYDLKKKMVGTTNYRVQGQI